MLTEAQQASIRFYTGYTGRFRQFDTRLDQSMRAIQTTPETEALVTNALTTTPPGLLALLQDIDNKLTAAHGRLRASKVGSIELNSSEIFMLRAEGRRHVGRLCALLGVERGEDVFGEGRGAFASATGGMGYGGGNYIGK